MLEKRVSCKKIKERTGIKRRTERVRRAEKGHGECGRRNSVWGDVLAPAWEARSACGDVEEHTRTAAALLVIRQPRLDVQMQKPLKNHPNTDTHSCLGQDIYQWKYTCG